MSKHLFYFIRSVFLFFMLVGCDDSVIYKVGNRVTLDYVIETNIGFKVIRQYLDTMIEKQGYNVPGKWLRHDKLVDIDSLDSKRIYFKHNPEEMYLLQFNGVLLLADVLNDDIVKDDWVATKANMPKNEEIRIKKRFKEEVLNKIEMLAKRDGLPDSVIYYKVKW